MPLSTRGTSWTRRPMARGQASPDGHVRVASAGVSNVHQDHRERRGRCTMITEHLEDTLVLHGDAMDEHLLADEGASRSEMVVAALGDETDNMFVALLAKRLGALRVAALLNTPGHTALASGSNGAGPGGSGAFRHLPQRTSRRQSRAQLPHARRQARADHRPHPVHPGVLAAVACPGCSRIPGPPRRLAARRESPGLRASASARFSAGVNTKTLPR